MAYRCRASAALTRRDIANATKQNQRQQREHSLHDRFLQIFRFLQVWLALKCVQTTHPKLLAIFMPREPGTVKQKVSLRYNSFIGNLVVYYFIISLLQSSGECNNGPPAADSYSAKSVVTQELFNLASSYKPFCVAGLVSAEDQLRNSAIAATTVCCSSSRNSGKIGNANTSFAARSVSGKLPSPYPRGLSASCICSGTG